LFWIPDAFTPNGDGRNDAFKPMSSGILNEGYELLIYNRWGALVFATQNRNTAWDGSYEGKPVPEGLYVYQIKFSYTDQKGITRKKNHKGQVSLIR
jgi:gliding motility-associated-like protein